MAAEIVPSSDWKAKLFDCFENPVMCLWACCVPCGAACMQAVDAYVFSGEKWDATRAFFLNCCLCCFGAAYNTKAVRERLKIDSNYAIDCVKWMFCPCCTAVQEWREVMLAKKGDDKTLIWRVAQGF
jgi:Cys-rich protein (TIGR01571 family)